MADQIPGPVGDSLAETGKKDEWIKTGKKLGEKEKQAKKSKVSSQEQAREKNAAAVGSKKDKSDPVRKAKLEADRAAREAAKQPKAKVTRRQSKRAKAPFPVTQTVDEFSGLQKLTKSISMRTSYKF